MVRGIARLILGLAVTGGASAAQCGYDSTWYRAPFWSGEYPKGITIREATTVRVRVEPSLDAPPTIACDLPKGANYHPWNADRIKTDDLEFVSFTRVEEFVVKKRYRSVVTKDADNTEVTLDLATGEKWQYLSYLGEGAFFMKHEGVVYIADQDLIENSDETGTKRAEKDQYHEWLKLRCGNGTVGWLFVRDLEGTPAVGGTSFDGYMKASDEKLPSEALTLSQAQRWAQVFSSKDANEAIGVAKLYGSQGARVVRADNGWLGVIFGPIEANSVEEIPSRENIWPSLPSDTLLSSGSSYVETVWKPSLGSPVIANGELEANGHLRLAAGRLTLEVTGSGGSDPYVTIEGSVESGPLFRLQTPSLPLSDFGNIEVEVVQLDPNTEFPQVVVRAFSGGAHCCTSHWILSETQSGNWRITQGATLDGGGYWYEDADDDGTIELLSADNSFLYTFASYAGSHPPIRISRFAAAELVDVSSAPGFADFFRQDTAGREFMAREDPILWRSNGFLAGWVALKARTGDIMGAWERMLSSFDPKSDFGVSVCPNPLDDDCEYDARRMLPFPVGLAVHLEENGYGRLPDALSEFVPAWARQKFTSAPSSSPSAMPPGPGTNPEPQVTSGTGFFVAPSRLVTNQHVVAECDELSVLYGNQKVSGTIFARDEENDLALIVADSGEKFGVLRTGVRLGEDVSVFGFPLAGILSTGGNFTRGNVTATTGVGDDSRYVQISAPVQPGNSGGPLLDESGNVLGVVTAKIDAIRVAAATNDIPQNINFAIKSSTLLAFLESHGVDMKLGDLGAPLSPADIAEKAQGFTARIQCN